MVFYFFFFFPPIPLEDDELLDEDALVLVSNGSAGHSNPLDSSKRSGMITTSRVVSACSTVFLFPLGPMFMLSSPSLQGVALATTAR